MAGLEVMYSKELAKQLTKIGVVLPGDPVNIGDIIVFPHGKKGLWPFRRPAPIGSFHFISSLEKLGVKTQISDPDPDPDTYIFSSRKTVDTDFDFGADGNGDGKGVSASGKLTVNFKAEGAIYFAAIDCRTRRLENLVDIEVNLREYSQKLIWHDTFIVTSLTIADKALIMQSDSNSAMLKISGDIKGLVTKKASDISADANISVNKFTQASFIIPWSDNVTVFFGLSRFVKKEFGMEPSQEMATMNGLDASEFKKLAGEFVNDDNDIYELEPVSALELLDEADAEELS